MFGLFAWFPILRAFVMSVQETNLVSAPTFVGLDNFGRVLADPQFGTAVTNTAWFALLALLFGFPVPIILAVLMSEVRRFRGLYSALAYLPVVIPPVVAVLLWRFFYDASPTACSTPCSAGSASVRCPGCRARRAMPAIVIEATWAAAGATVIIYLERSERAESDMEGEFGGLNASLGKLGESSGVKWSPAVGAATEPVSRANTVW